MTGHLLKAIFAGLCITTCPIPAFAGHFQVLEDLTLPERPGATPGQAEIIDATPSANGGLLLAGRQGSYSAWTMHVSDNMKPDWVGAVDQGWPGIGARALADARDGGFWAVGYGRLSDTRAAERKNREPVRMLEIGLAVSYDYVARLDRTGKQLWRRPLFTGTPRRLYCIREAADGLVVLGDDSMTYRRAGDALPPATLSVPWLAKLDQEGRVLWEHTLVGDDQAVLVRPLNLQEPLCTRLQIAVDGRITVATTVDEIEGAVNGPEGTTLPDHYYDYRKSAGTLVVQLDGGGQVLHTARTDNADGAFLFAGANGYSLVEHMWQEPDRKKLKGANLLHIMAAMFANIQASGVRVTRFDNNLQKLDTQEIKLPAFFGRVSAVLPARSGGYFVAGCDESAYNSIAHITPAASVSAIERIKPSTRMNQCDTFGLAQGRNDGELLMFYGNSLVGNHIARLKMSAD